MYKVFPELKKFKIEFSWGGTLAISINRLPIFGTIMNQKLYYAHAYSGHGLAMSIMGGKMVAEKILNKSNNLICLSKLIILKFQVATCLEDHCIPQPLFIIG